MLETGTSNKAAESAKWKEQHQCTSIHGLLEGFILTINVYL
jgi:hypothetical protein